MSLINLSVSYFSHHSGKPITVTMEICVSQIVNTNSLIEAMKREIETSLSYLPINGSSLEVMTSGNAWGRKG